MLAAATPPPIPWPEPPLADEMVRLRPWLAADAAALVAAWGDPAIRRWSPAPPPEWCTEEYAAKWIDGAERRRVEGVAIDLVISDPSPECDLEAVLGEVGLGPIDWEQGEADIGWWVAPSARGRGTATRSVRLLARWAETRLGLTVRATIDPSNQASLRVAQRAGVRLVSPPALPPPATGGRRAARRGRRPPLPPT
ncbi:MAG: GNAT family N-acetyltransferase [Acidimicrobiales bacterium]